jgi:hypothetical protein
MKEGRPHCCNRSNKEDHIGVTDPISNIKFVERGKINIHSTQIHDH